MSLHAKPEANTPEIKEGLFSHGLEVQTPSQLSDGFRLGYLWAIKTSEERARLYQEALEDAEWRDSLGER